MQFVFSRVSTAFQRHNCHTFGVLRLKSLHISPRQLNHGTITHTGVLSPALISTRHNGCKQHPTFTSPSLGRRHRNAYSEAILTRIQLASKLAAAQGGASAVANYGGAPPQGQQAQYGQPAGQQAAPGAGYVGHASKLGDAKFC